MLEGLKSRLQGAIDNITKKGYIDKNSVEELVKDIQRAFIEGDVDISLVSELSENIRKKALKEKPPAGVTAREHVVKVVYDELVRFLGKEKPVIGIKKKKILLCGLFGSGKTTTAAKLGRFYKDKGMKVSLIAADTVRPAAYEQLEQLSKKIGVPFFGIKDEKDASVVVKKGLEKLEEHSDIIIVDSSGRDALDDSLVKEIKSIDKAFDPDEKILVLPADIGQAAKEQATAFHDALNITDVIVTKMDSTAKGGGALTACTVTGAKVKFIGTGEYVDSFEIYDPKRFVSRLLGFPDLATLLDKVKKVSSPDAEKRAGKMLSGNFTMDDFISQLGEVNKMGSISQIADMMGISGKLKKKLPKGMMDVQEEKMKKWQHIVNSLTPKEKAKPDIVNMPRIRRIAKGAGVEEREVRDMFANYKKVKKTMKGLSPSKLKRSPMGKMLKGLGI
ncbi:signal recognition particle protein [archaeon]|nr:signal recognition particle protein [archaeon]